MHQEFFRGVMEVVLMFNQYDVDLILAFKVGQNVSFFIRLWCGSFCNQLKYVKEPGTTACFFLF